MTNGRERLTRECGISPRASINKKLTTEVIKMTDILNPGKHLVCTYDNATGEIVIKRKEYETRILVVEGTVICRHILREVKEAKNN